MESKKALLEFIDIIKDADNTFLDPDKKLDNQGKIDGYNHLFHLMQTAIEFYLYNDPLRPQLMSLADNNHKILGDNVDAVYYFSQIRSDQEYLITGQRFDSCYLSFCLYGGDPDGELADRVTLNLNHRDIEFDEQGCFSIKLTPNPKGPNEYKMEEDSVTLFTREYFVNRFESTQSIINIQNLSPVEKSLPFTDEQLAKRIRTMAMFFQCTTWIAPLPVTFPLNDFLPPFQFDSEQGGWGTVDNIYCLGRFQLKENQYLKIHFTSPNTCYWGIQTWNYLMQSMNYKEYPVCINMGTAEQEADGSYIIILSHRPCEKNWISTAGYKEAVMFCRWLLADSMPEQPSVELCEW